MRTAVTLPLVGAAVLTAGALLTRTLCRSGTALREAVARCPRSLSGLRPRELTNGSLPERLRKLGL